MWPPRTGGHGNPDALWPRSPSYRRPPPPAPLRPPAASTPAEIVRIITGERIPGPFDIAMEKGGGVTLCKTDSYGNSCRGTPRRRRHDGGGAGDERACDHAADTTLTGRPRSCAPAGLGPADDRADHRHVHVGAGRQHRQRRDPDDAARL